MRSNPRRDGHRRDRAAAAKLTGGTIDRPHTRRSPATTPPKAASSGHVTPAGSLVTDECGAARMATLARRHPAANTYEKTKIDPAKGAPYWRAVVELGGEGGQKRTYCCSHGRGSCGPSGELGAESASGEHGHGDERLG